MFNGNDHGTVGQPSQHVDSKPEAKPAFEEKPRPADEKPTEPKKVAR